MPKLTQDTRCYVAWRKHPTLGPLIKVGSSHDPKQRCRSLGARLLGVLPYEYERRLRRELAGNEAWPRYADWIPGRKAEPIFTGQSEWFFATSEVVEAVRRCVQGAEQ